MGEQSHAGDAFARALDELKRRGSNLLVVGPPSEHARSAICRRLLGDSTAGDRRRLFVVTDGESSCVDRCDGPISPATARVVERTTPTRGATVTAAAGGGSVTTATESATEGPARREVSADRLGTLAAAINEEVLAFLQHTDGFESSELRLCFDSLTPLVAEYDATDVRRFLDVVTSRVHSCDGMAHYHLAADRRDDAVRDLAPLFDAVVELRMEDGVLEQRWHVTHHGVVTDWLPL
jgi:hypothetical protein